MIPGEAAAGAGSAGQGAAAPPGQGGAGQPPAGAGAAEGEGSPASAGTQAGQTGGQPGSGTPEPEFEYIADGQTHKVKGAKAVMELLSKGHGFTTKTQELAEQKRRLEAEYQDRVQKSVSAEIERLLAEGKGDEGGEAGKPNAVEARVQRLQQDLENDRLERALGPIREKFPGLDENLIMLTASAQKIQRYEELMGVAQKLHEKMESDRSAFLEKALGDENHPVAGPWRQKVVDAYLAKKAKEGKPAGETGTAGTPGGGAGPVSPKNSREERELTMEALNKL